ncbi:MAG: redox-sensing transcriptional repressor Rex [Kiritimatiellae bacterium]|nr:redox-sensing transcriptional repressor Rex [Kiritimatiellia bacterium]
MISPQSVKRYPLYLREVRECLARGDRYVSAAVLAKTLGMDPILARKDLAAVGVTGRPHFGFPAVELRNAIMSTLGWANETEAVLCGAGSLGKALLGYAGFRDHNLSIVLAFDTSPKLVGKRIHGVPVHDFAEMGAMVRKLNVKIGILAVPSAAAQVCAEVLVASGIKGIWNFTTVPLALPKTLAVRNVDLAESLALLSHEISRRSIAGAGEH